MALSSSLGIRWESESYNPYVVSFLALLGIQAMLSFVCITLKYNIWGGLGDLTTHKSPGIDWLNHPYYQWLTELNYPSDGWLTGLTTHQTMVQAALTTLNYP